MADKDPETEKLELSLFRRKRKSDEHAPAPEVEETPGPATAPSGAAATASTAAADPIARRASPTGAVDVDTPTAAAPSDTQVIPATPRRKGATSMTPRASRGSGGARVAPKPPRRAVTLPPMSPGLAVPVVGAVVGLAAVVLTFASLKLCELVTGTDSCGGLGLLVLLAVVVLMILGGAAALRTLGVPDPGGLSFLGVAMFVALCLVALLPYLLEVWMILVAPILSAISFSVAQWIVTRFDDDILEPGGPPPHDVR